MPNENLLNSLDFTRSAGGLSQGDSDDTFADVISTGGFPSKQKISKLQKIEIFQSDGTAVIVGLKVTYLVDSQAVTVNHGIVGGVTNVGTLEIGANQLLVGASGRFKNTADETKNGRISFIVFSVFDNETGYTTVTEPFGSQESVGDSWGSYGPVIALEGTVSGDYGLTSLGFTKLTQGVPGFPII